MKISGAKAPESGNAVRVMADGTAVAVFNVGGVLFGVDAKCTHVGGPIDQGPVSGTVVTCPLHGSQFDLRTGALVRGPATRPLKAYRIRVEPDGLTIDAM
jgi:nitrite reductase/ring-hydroxylating ferredoxin subunit